MLCNSDSVTVKPFIQAQLQSDNSGSFPGTITGTLTWDLAGADTPQAVSFSTSGAHAGDLLILSVEVSSSVTTSGRYAWRLDLTTPGGVATVTGYSFVVAQDGSSLGAGWTFSGTDQLIDIPADTTDGLPAGQLRAFGTGEYRFYADNGSGGFFSPTGDNGTLSAATGGGTTTYTYSTPDGQSLTFDNGGDETQWTSADGKQTLQYPPFFQHLRHEKNRTAVDQPRRQH